MEVSTHHPQNRWSSYGWHPLKSPVVFFAQIIILYIVIIVSIINLSLQDCGSSSCACDLWTTLLSSSIAYLLPNPSLKLAKNKTYNIDNTIDELDSVAIARRLTPARGSDTTHQYGQEEE